MVGFLVSIGGLSFAPVALAGGKGTNLVSLIPLVTLYKEGGGTVASDGDSVVLKFSKKFNPGYKLSTDDVTIADQDVEFFAPQDPNFYYARLRISNKVRTGETYTLENGGAKNIVPIYGKVIPEGPLPFQIVFIRKKTKALYHVRLTTDGSKIDFFRQDVSPERTACEQAPVIQLTPADNVEIQLASDYTDKGSADPTKATVSSYVKLYVKAAKDQPEQAPASPGFSPPAAPGKVMQKVPLLDQTQIADRYAGYSKHTVSYDPYTSWVVMDLFSKQGPIPFSVCFKDPVSNLIVGRVRATTDGSQVNFINPFYATIQQVEEAALERLQKGADKFTKQINALEQQLRQLETAGIFVATVLDPVNEMTNRLDQIKSTEEVEDAEALVSEISLSLPSLNKAITVLSKQLDVQALQNKVGKLKALILPEEWKK